MIKPIFYPDCKDDHLQMNVFMGSCAIKADVLNVEVFFINQNQKHGMNFNQTTVP